MAIVVRTDLSMQKGKIASQVAHAAVQLVVTQDRQGSAMKQWLKWGQPKIILKVTGLADLEEVQRRAEELGLRNQPVFDAGNTQVPRGSLTVLGIGPDNEEKINQVVGHLKLL